MADAVAEEYKSSLADLNFNSKPLINMLTMLAEDNIKYAPQIVQTIADHIKTVPSEVKLPGLYLVDSIIKNVGKQYLTLFSQNLVTLFSCVFEKVEENTRSLLYKLRQTWNDVLPNKILYAVDVKIQKLDPAWPVTAQSPAQSIHINPKFLGSNAQNSTDASAAKKEEELIKAKQVAVVKQLVIKQEQLRLLEQKKKEIAAGKLLLAKTTAKASSIDPRALAKANPKLSHRDPRLQKINPVPISKCVDTTTFVSKSPYNTSTESPYSTSAAPLALVNTLSTAASTPSATISAPTSAVNDPSAAFVPNVKISNAVVESQTLIKSSNSENVLLSKELDKDIKSTSKPSIASPKKSNSKKADGHLQDLKNSSSDKSKNLSSKSHASPAKDQDPHSDNKVHERKFDMPKEIERSPRRTRSSKETEKSPRSPKKKPSSPEEKSKISTRSTRSQSKLETLRKLPFRQRSRSPIHKTEKSKADILDKEKHGKRFRSGDKETETSETSTEANVRVQKGRARGKRESNLSSDEDSKENETAPPEKKIREDDSDDNSDRSREAPALFGKEDQDYRQLSSAHKENVHHKGWAQYKESHPDEFKSPLRSSRDNGNIKTRPFQSVSSDENYFPPEYDRLGRRRLHRGRPDQRFFARRGFFRGPGNRFDNSFPPMEPPFNDSLASMMLTDPNIILQQAEAKFRLGRIAENEYLELRRDLENMLQSEEYRRLRDQTFRMQCPERFHMSESQGFGNQHSGMGKMGSVPFHKGEPVKIQGPHLPPPAVCTFKLDNKMRTIHFVDEKAFVIMDNDEPRELTFKGEPHQIFIESLPEPITLSFNGQSADFDINGGKRHTIRFGAPSRELYIDNYPYEIKFGGGPIAAMLEENRIFKIRIGGSPPQVVLGDKPSFDLFSRLRAAQATGAQPLKPPPPPPMEHPEGQRMPQSGNLPVDVDMRMSVDKSGDGFDLSSRDDMKDVDWRHLTPSKPSDESKYFKPIQPPPEAWDQSGPPPVNRNYPDRKPQLDHQEWKNSVPFPSDRPPLLPREWETLPPPPFPKLNGSPRNTPPNDKEWDHQHPHEAMDRQDWRENDNRQDVSALPSHHQQLDQRHHRFDNPRNSPHHIKEEPSQYHDGPRDNMRPRMPHSIRPRFEGKPPQYGTWQRPNFRERGPAPRATSNLMPPPLPPFQMRPPLLGVEPKRTLLPLPSYPPLRPPLAETVHEKVLRATTVPVTKDSSGALSSDVAQSAEDKSEPTAVPASPINIDVGTLFQKLVAAGIINSKGVNESNEERKPKEESEANTKKKEKENNPDDEPLPKIPLKLESLRKHHPAVTKALYRGSQCASCGMRFKEIQSDHYSRHLDWHFRMNRREKDGVKKAFSRRWYYEVEDWNQFEEFEDFEERAPSYFELQADGTQVQTDEPVDVPSVPASGQETEVCVVCDEPFQLFWVEEEEEWHLRDAVRHEEQAYHPACYEDHKKASEIPETPVEDTIPLVKNEPSEETTKDETTAGIDAVPQEVTVKKEEDDSEPINTEDAQATEETMATAEDLAELKIKEEPDDDILEGKPGEEEIIGLISESEEMEVDSSEEPKVEPKMVVQSGGGIVLKIKAESMQPMSPATPPSSGVEKEAGSEMATQDSDGEEFRPPTPDPRFQVLPPVQKGTELSGLCCIM